MKFVLSPHRSRLTAHNFEACVQLKVTNYNKVTSSQCGKARTGISLNRNVIVNTSVYITKVTLIVYNKSNFRDI